MPPRNFLEFLILTWWLYKIFEWNGDDAITHYLLHMRGNIFADDDAVCLCEGNLR